MGCEAEKEWGNSRTRLSGAIECGRGGEDLVGSGRVGRKFRLQWQKFLFSVTCREWRATPRTLNGSALLQFMANQMAALGEGGREGGRLE